MTIGLNGDATLIFDHLQPYNPFQLFIWSQTSDREADFRVQLQPSVDLVTLLFDIAYQETCHLHRTECHA